MLARGDGNLDVGAMSVTHCLASVWPSACVPRGGEGGQLLGLHLASSLTAPDFLPHRLHRLVHHFLRHLVHHFLPTLWQAIEWALAHLEEEENPSQAKSDAHLR